MISMRMPALLLRRALFPVLAGAMLLLAGCVQSDNPLLTGAKPLMGEIFEAHFYENFVDGKASNVHTAVYRWTDDHYKLVRGGNTRVTSFAGIALDTDTFLVEGVSKESNGFNYWIARKIVDGVFLIAPVDENDADEPTRAAACTGKAVSGFCFVEKKDELIRLAKATAAKTLRNPTLGVLVLRREGV